MISSLLKLATRQSQLALWQANFVKTALQTLHPEVKITLVPLSTKGDEIQDRSLAELGGKGLFVKRLEEALLQGEADFAVHSMKDVPPELAPQFCVPAIFARDAPFDVLVTPHASSLKQLPKGALIGTSSVRRIAQLKYFRPDLQFQAIRGNVDSRLEKLLSQNYDALILAQAGLVRLGKSHYIKEVISTEICLPSVGQGALGIECLRTNKALISVLEPLNHLDTSLCVEAERSMNAHLHANCTSPVGSYAEILDQRIHLRAVVLNREGTKKLAAEAYADLDQPLQLGKMLAETLLNQGAAALY